MKMSNAKEALSKSNINNSSLYKPLKSKKSEEKELNSSQKEKYIKLRYRGKEKNICFIRKREARTGIKYS